MKNNFYSLTQNPWNFAQLIKMPQIFSNGRLKPPFKMPIQKIRFKIKLTQIR
jgi:hypothetical protein